MVTCTDLSSEMVERCRLGGALVFERLSALSLVARLVVWGLGLLTLVVALLVVASVEVLEVASARVRNSSKARGREAPQ